MKAFVSRMSLWVGLGVSLALMSDVFQAAAAPQAPPIPQTTLIPKAPAAPKDLPAQAYQMSLVWMVDADTPREFIFVVNGAVGYRTVAALKHSISSFPPGSTLTWAPSDARIGGEPLLSSPEDMKKFAAFCKSAKVKLVIVPGG